MNIHVLTPQQKAMKALRSIIMVSFYLLHPFIANATGCDGDIIYINGVQWGFLDKPIAHIDSTSYAKFLDFLPKGRSTNTANWEGYTAHWTIKDQQLYLLKVEVEMYNKEKDERSILTLDADTLKNIFAPYYTQDGIFAQWFSHNTRAAKGKLIRYEHSAFNRNLEEELVMTIRSGKVMEEQLWHNTKKEGLKLADLRPALVKRFPIHLFPELQGKRLVVMFKAPEMLADGHLVDCEIYIRLPNEKEYTKDQNHPIIKALKETMRAIYPWEVLYIHGKYTLESRMFMLAITFAENL